MFITKFTHLIRCFLSQVVTRTFFSKLFVVGFILIPGLMNMSGHESFNKLQLYDGILVRTVNFIQKAGFKPTIQLRRRDFPQRIWSIAAATKGISYHLAN